MALPATNVIDLTIDDNDDDDNDELTKKTKIKPSNSSQLQRPPLSRVVTPVPTPSFASQVSPPLRPPPPAVTQVQSSRTPIPPPATSNGLYARHRLSSQNGGQGVLGPSPSKKTPIPSTAPPLRHVHSRFVPRPYTGPILSPANREAQTPAENAFLLNQNNDRIASQMSRPAVGAPSSTPRVPPQRATNVPVASKSTTTPILPPSNEFYRSTVKNNNNRSPNRGPIASPRTQSGQPTLETVDRPVKRRRTDEDPPPAPGIKDKLSLCLGRQVFPHIDAALSRINRERIDTDLLGIHIIREVVDYDFKRYYNEGGGQLSPAAEGLVAGRIHRLIIENSNKPIYLLPVAPKPPPGPQHPPILPSIENTPNKPIQHKPTESDADEYRDTKTGRSDSADSEEDLAPPPPRRRRKRESLRTPRRAKKTATPTPQRVRARVKASQWQSGRTYEAKKEGSPIEHHSQWFEQSARPYALADTRKQIAAGVQTSRHVFVDGADLLQPHLYHVDFGEGEAKYLQYLARAIYGKPMVRLMRTTLQDLRHLMKKVPDMRVRMGNVIRSNYKGFDRPPNSLTKRTADDISNFLSDLYAKKHSLVQQSLSIEIQNHIAWSDSSRANKIPTALLAREITGNRLGLGTGRAYQNFTSTVKSNREDHLEAKVEWTNCAGDIMTASWVSKTHFICGTTTHSDSHNQQYNKPGNLLLGSTVTNTLRAYPDHRIVRPVVDHGENALESMRESQDPWLYTSIPSSDYDPTIGLAFTSSFDKTVKVWKFDSDAMTAAGTWEHGGNVNFVVASKNGLGTVATAADVPTEAVRVYHLERCTEVSKTRFESYSCTRIHDEDHVASDKWAYYPAAIRWGIAPAVRHLLLIGYSPRSPTGKDHDIPEDKQDTGELCLWDTITGEQVKVNAAKTQNVFEVVWHPSRSSFAAATSASQTLEKMEQKVGTQIRIFEVNETGQYAAVKTLDCSAIDINELTIRPNSIIYSYVAAGCTDGRVYVWDTSGSDLPMCILEHGEPVEEMLYERELEDVGVKFTAWATTTNRLYTGSSDGVLKVWDICSGKGAHVKDLIEIPAPIIVGAFSPDCTKLVIGDGSGRVYLLALEDTESEDQARATALSSGFLNLNIDGKQRSIRRPRPFIPHPEVPPPGEPSSSTGPKLETGQARSKEYLTNSQLVIHPDITVGAVQGENYVSTGLFRAEAHLNMDAMEPLRGEFERLQQEKREPKGRKIVPATRVVPESNDFRGQHERNQELDLAVDGLDEAVQTELSLEQAEVDFDGVDLDYESSIEDFSDTEDVDCPYCGVPSMTQCTCELAMMQWS
ncbi:hypothetical protein F5Y15DRAFT_368695 [Xylariaceae sp. FL0016]|nr:hypothetical protein F5Y15DRAFT_368695 [Xylariaceae sp. FL0016]